jgi:hypothetical protein
LIFSLAKHCASLCPSAQFFFLRKKKGESGANVSSHFEFPHKKGKNLNICSSPFFLLNHSFPLAKQSQRFSERINETFTFFNTKLKKNFD